MHDSRQELERIGLEMRKESLDRQEMHLAARVAKWRAEAGDSLDAMLESSEVAMQIALRSDGSRRSVAIQVLASYWRVGPQEDYLRLLSKLMNGESDTDTRAMAAVEIGRIFQGSIENEWTSIHCKVVFDEQEELEVRHAAYIALNLMAKRLPPRLTSEADGTGFRRFRFPEDVDWGFVSKLLAGQPLRQPNFYAGCEIRPSEWEHASIAACDPSVAKSASDGSCILDDDTVTGLIQRFPLWAFFSIRARIRLRDGNATLAIGDASEAVARNSHAFEPLLTRALAFYSTGDHARGMSDMRAYRASLANAIASLRK